MVSCFQTCLRVFQAICLGVGVVVDVQVLQTSYLSVDLNPSLRPLTFHSRKPAIPFKVSKSLS